MASSDLTAPRLDLDYTRGDNRSITVTLLDDAGDPIDASSDTVEGKLRRDEDGELVSTLDVDDTDADTGVFVITVDTDDVQSLSGDYTYDIAWTSNSVKTTVLKGTWHFERNVTYTDA